MDADRSTIDPARPAPDPRSPIRQGLVLLARTVAAVAGFVALIVIAVGAPPTSGIAAVSLGVLGLAAETDRRTFRLPDRLVLLAALPVVLFLLVAVLIGARTPVMMAVIGALLAVAPVAALHAMSPAAMGFGDVKAALVLGAALGLLEPRLAPAALAIAAASAFVTARATRRRRIALGPHLILAAVAVAVVWTLAGPEVSSWR